MKKNLLFPLALTATALLCGCSDPDARETFGEKSEWSVLQGIELKNRATPITEPVFEVRNEIEVMGVRGLQGQNIWLLLKPKAPPFYKQMPAGSYEVPKELVDKLVREHRLSYTVETVFKSLIKMK